MSESGGLAGTRTPDQCLKRALLYQLSYQPTKPFSVLSGSMSEAGMGTRTVEARGGKVLNPWPIRKGFSKGGMVRWAD